jgi:dienelactone hydrolase
MRQDVEFDAEGVTLRGWLYLPDGGEGPVPTVVMAHGFSAVKEMYLDRFAEVFAGAGLGALVFDNRNFGASDGEPRQEIDPWAQVRDYRHAISYASLRPEVDAGRIGIWGSSYSGGHVLVVGAIDSRVKCVVAQVPLVSGHANLRALVRADLIAGLRQQFDEDRAVRFQGKAPAMVPIVADDPLAPCALPTPDSYQWFTETQQLRAPSWRNEVTLRQRRDVHRVRAGLVSALHQPDAAADGRGEGRSPDALAAGDHRVRARRAAQEAGDPPGSARRIGR